MASFRHLVLIKLLGIVRMSLVLLQLSKSLALFYCELCLYLMQYELFEWWPRARLEMYFIIHRHVQAALLDIVKVVHRADVAAEGPEVVAVAQHRLVVVLLGHFSLRHIQILISLF